MQHAERLNKDNFYIAQIGNGLGPQKINTNRGKTLNAKSLNPDPTVFLKQLKLLNSPFSNSFINACMSRIIEKVN